MLRSSAPSARMASPGLTQMPIPASLLPRPPAANNAKLTPSSSGHAAAAWLCSGGRWAPEAAAFICLLARACAAEVPTSLRAAARAAWVVRWGGILAVEAQRAFAEKQKKSMCYATFRLRSRRATVVGSLVHRGAAVRKVQVRDTCGGTKLVSRDVRKPKKMRKPEFVHSFLFVVTCIICFVRWSILQAVCLKMHAGTECRTPHKLALNSLDIVEGMDVATPKSIAHSIALFFAMRRWATRWQTLRRSHAAAPQDMHARDALCQVRSTQLNQNSDLVCRHLR